MPGQTTATSNHTHLLEMPAVHIVDPPTTLVKSLGEHRGGGYLVLWGGPDQRDLENEYFTPDTTGLDMIFKIAGRIPGFYNHQLDPVFSVTPTGYIDVMVPDAKGLWVEEHLFTPNEMVDMGLWIEKQLDVARRYQEALRVLLGKKALFWSSGTLPAARRVDGDGWIKSWIIAEATKTVTPAEYRGTDVVSLSKLYANIGVSFEDVQQVCKSGHGECGVDKGAADARRRRIQKARLLTNLCDLAGDPALI